MITHSLNCEQPSRAYQARVIAVDNYKIENGKDSKPNKGELPGIATEIQIKKAHKRCAYLLLKDECDCLCHKGG